jgi:hypothetical protein
MMDNFYDEWKAITCQYCNGKGSCPFCSSTGKLYERRKMIRNVHDLLNHYCAQSVNQLKKGFFKYTTCGAWIEVSPTVVSLGSIVEGVERTTQTYILHFPFDADEIESALAAVEEEAKEIWDETHGCEACWQGGILATEYGEEIGPTDYGMRPVDPDCPECGGEGIVI